MLNSYIKPIALSLGLMIVCGAAGVSAQKRNSRPVPKSPEAAPKPTLTPEGSVPSATPEALKKNQRPDGGAKVSAAKTPDPPTGELPYRYEFTQPDFVVDSIVIAHDESGRGTISFSKQGFDDSITEPLELSAATMEKLNAAFDALNFVESTEDYQFERDFSNMGNVAITLKKNGKERTAKYNWTSNKDAKELMDEYRRIANQFIWMFDIDLARENQPLETPRLVDSFQSLMARNEIADPKQMVPFLTKLSNDERVPLIGRNKIAKIIKQIEKQKK